MTPRLPRKVLFICTGNTCRSLMAELLLKDFSEKRGLGLEAKSCGVAAERFFQVPNEVWESLAAAGVKKKEDHVAQLVSRELLGWADLALTMTQNHRDIVIDKFPEFGSKVHVLRVYAGLREPDVADPMRQPKMVYIACRDRIREALEAFLKRYEHPQNARP